MGSLQLGTKARAKENHTTLGTVEALFASKDFFFSFFSPGQMKNVVGKKKAHQTLQS